MPTINMIASRRALKRRQEQNVRKLVYGVSAEVGCFLVAASVLYAHVVSLRGQSSDLGAQMQKLSPRVAENDRLTKATALLLPKVTTLDGAKADTLFWYTSIATVAGSLPPNAWLTSLGVTGSAAPGGVGAAPGSSSGADPTVLLSGVTLNQATVGEAMLRMNQSPNLDHVDLAFVQSQKTGTTDTVSFQMTVHLKPEPSAAAAQEGASHVQHS